MSPPKFYMMNFQQHVIYRNAEKYILIRSLKQLKNSQME
jgi:hypothetical protein